MLRIGTLLAVFVALAAAAPQPVSNVLELDLTPEEAQKYLNSPPFTEPKLASRTAVLPLVKYNDPRFRAAEAGPTLGHYWKNGHEIENPEDYVDEVYNARQYHGQDGLGAYVYGYETPESAKVENKERSGNVAGSYTYRTADNELIKVRYWADSQGFHQEDNLPKVVLKPIEEAEDVRQARLAHEKAWQEAAAAARQQPDPQSLPYHGPTMSRTFGRRASGRSQHVEALWTIYSICDVTLAGDYPCIHYTNAPKDNPRGEYYRQFDYQPAASEQQGAVVAAPGQEGQVREAKAYYQQGPQQYSSSTVEPEPTGPPRGFFYQFDYPVSIISPKNSVKEYQK